MDKTYKMKCKQVKRLLHVHLDGFLDEELKKKVKVHLLECMNCQREARFLQKAVDLVKSYPAQSPPRDLPLLIQEKIRQHAKTAQRQPAVFKKRRLGWQTVTAYALSLALFGILLYLIGEKTNVSPGKLFSSCAGFLSSLFSSISGTASTIRSMSKPFFQNLRNIFHSLPKPPLSQEYKILIYIALPVFIFLNLWFFFTSPEPNGEKTDN